MSNLLQSRIAKLRATQKAQEKRQHNYPSLAFIACPTCPPSTGMVMQGGTGIETSALFDMEDIGRTSHLAWTVPTIVRDLVDEDQAHVDCGCSLDSNYIVQYDTPNWVTAYAYKLSVLHLMMPQQEEQPADSDWKFFLHASVAEYATAQDAENFMMTWISSYEEYEPIPGARTSYEDYPYWPYPHVWSSGWPRYGDYRITGIPLCGIILKNNGTTGTGRHFLPIDAVNRGRSYTWPRDLRPQWIGT